MMVRLLLNFDPLALNLWTYKKHCDVCQNNDGSVTQTIEMVAPTPPRVSFLPSGTISAMLIATR